MKRHVKAFRDVAVQTCRAKRFPLKQFMEDYGLGDILTAADAGDHAVVHEAEPQATWSLCPLAMPAGYQGAVAVEGEVRRVISWQAVLRRAGSK